MRIFRSALIILPLLGFSATALAQQPKPEATPQREYSGQEVMNHFSEILDARLNDEHICLSFRATTMVIATVRNGAKELVETKQTSQLPQAMKNLNFFLDRLLERAHHQGNEIRIDARDVGRLLDSSTGQSANPSSGICPLFPFCK